LETSEGRTRPLPAEPRRRAGAWRCGAQVLSSAGARAKPLPLSAAAGSEEAGEESENGNSKRLEETLSHGSRQPAPAHFWLSKGESRRPASHRAAPGPTPHPSTATGGGCGQLPAVPWEGGRPPGVTLPPSPRPYACALPPGASGLSENTRSLPTPASNFVRGSGGPASGRRERRPSGAEAEGPGRAVDGAAGTCAPVAGRTGGTPAGRGRGRAARA